MYPRSRLIVVYVMILTHTLSLSLSISEVVVLLFQVVWGKISMVDAERRLLANALQDPDNQHFVLLSDR